MWRSILAMILLPSLTAAQAAQTQPVSPAQAADPKPTPSQRARAPLPHYRPYVLYDGIRRGTAEDVAISVHIGDYFTTPRSPVSGLVPLNLELQPAEGFTFTNLRYPKAFKQKVKFQTTAFPVAGSEIFFKVHAHQNVALGAHVLKGKLTVQPVDMISGVGIVRQLDVEIQINVVEHDAKVIKTGWPFSHLPMAAWVVIIVLSPVLIALWLPLTLLCTMAGSNGCLD